MPQNHEGGLEGVRRINNVQIRVDIARPEAKLRSSKTTSILVRTKREEGLQPHFLFLHHDSKSKYTSFPAQHLI